MRSRTVPILKFINDDSVTRGAAMEDLIRKAIGEDESKSTDDADVDQTSRDNGNED